MLVHNTPARGRTRFVDAVVTDAEARDHSARRQRVVERSGVLTVAHDDVAHAAIANDRGELVLGIRSAAAIEPAGRGETVFAFAVFRLGDEHDGFRVGISSRIYH